VKQGYTVMHCQKNIKPYIRVWLECSFQVISCKHGDDVDFSDYIQ